MHFTKLPNEIKLEALKFQKFAKFTDIKQTNRKILDLVDFHADVLPRQKLESISFCSSIAQLPYIRREDYYEEEGKDVEDFEENLLQILNEVRTDEIPLLVYRKTKIPKTKIPAIVSISIMKEPFTHAHDIELPLFPRDEEDLRYVRFWLRRFSSVFFESFTAYQGFFNPDLIRLLFPQNVGKYAFMFSAKHFRFEMGYEAIYNNQFMDFCNTRIHAELLTLRLVEPPFTFPTGMNDLTLCQGRNIGKIHVWSDGPISNATLHNLLIEHAESSCDPLKMVSDIEFWLPNNIRPNMRSAKFIGKHLEHLEHLDWSCENSDYELKNRHFPRIVYGIATKRFIYNDGTAVDSGCFRIWLKQS